MGSISMPQGRGSRKHNIRDYDDDKIPKNIFVDRISENAILVDEPIRHAYDRIFGDALNEYNNKQKRKDRKIDNYYNQILKSKNGEKPFYEDVLQWGKKEDFSSNPDLRAVAKECLITYIEGSREDGIPSFEERNPNLELIGAYIHMDEASPHMHFDYIPVATGYKQGLLKRNGLDRAMKSIIKMRTGEDYKPRKGLIDLKGKCTDNATRQWKDMERAIFKKICLKHNLVVEEEIPTPERDNLSVAEYKRYKKVFDSGEKKKLLEEAEDEIVEKVQMSLSEKIYGFVKKGFLKVLKEAFIEKVYSIFEDFCRKNCVMFDIETMCDIDKALDKSIDSITMQYQEHSIDNGIKEAISNTPIKEPEIRQAVRHVRRYR